MAAKGEMPRRQETIRVKMQGGTREGGGMGVPKGGGRGGGGAGRFEKGGREGGLKQVRGMRSAERVGCIGLINLEADLHGLLLKLDLDKVVRR